MELRIKRKNKAVSLSEALVAIALIGVIFVLTVPDVFFGTNEEELHVQWQKQYRNVGDALLLVIDKEANLDTSSDFMFYYHFLTVLKFTDANFWHQVSGLNYKYYKNSANTLDTSSGDWTTYLTAVTSEGSFWGFNAISANCSDSSIAPFTNICGEIYIDVNGKKEPNMIGKDFFKVVITKVDGEYFAKPAGQEGTANCVASDSDINNSWNCSSYALYRGPDEMP